MAHEPGPTPEAVLEPDLPIVDAHHHLVTHTGHRYLIEEFQADVDSGHRIEATVYVECNSMYRKDGNPAMRPVGEVEFAAGVAAMSESGRYGPSHICAAIVGAADLRLGSSVEPVLEAMTIAGGGRFRGIRDAANWDADPSINLGASRPYAPRGLLLDAGFREGVKCLARRGLVFDSYQYYPQLPEFCQLADAVPDATIVLNHCGGLVGTGPYAKADNFANWKAKLAEASRRPNVMLKLGGLSARRCGFGFENMNPRPTSANLAEAWRPYIETSIELFGPSRCLFESNFPHDRTAGSYRAIWNAFKLITARYTASDKAAMYGQTSRRVYGING